MQILYVDDEPLNLMLFERVLKRKYKILTARSAEEGLEQIAVNPLIPVVLTDMKMPGMNGIDFVKEAKKCDPDKSYFILTGYEITDEIAIALEENVIDRYFRKPYDFIEIEKAINEVINSSQ